MNKVTLIGRLTRDPDIRSTAGDNPMTIARYCLAVDRKFTKGEKETDYINCVAFGKGAEFAEKYLRKGTKIAVSGRIQTGSYKNKDGQTVYTTDVIVEEQEFCESRNSESAPSQAQIDANTIPQPRKAPGNIDPEWTNIPDNISEEELPFGG